MTQADRVHSTPPTNTPIDPTRRGILATIAGGAAAAAMPSAARAVPASEVDPIFEAIHAHRMATAAVEECAAEVGRLRQMADETVGPAEIDIPSMVEPGTVVCASCWWDIERAVPREEYPELYADHLARLQQRKAAHEAITGDLDAVHPDQVSNAEWQTCKSFAETRPTTLPGLLAMIAYAAHVEKKDPEAFTDCSPLIATMAAAARALVRGQK